MKSGWFIVKIFSLVVFISGSGSKPTIEILEKGMKYVQS